MAGDAGTGFDHPWAALDHAAATAGERAALAFPHEGARLTFAQWRERALAVAGGLAGLGIEAGDHVALLAENRAGWAVTQLACAALGAVLVPLNTHYRRDDLAYVLAAGDIRAVVLSRAYRSNPYLETVTALRPDLPRLAHVVAIDALPEAAGFEPRPVDPDRPAALLYTSGTTGFPKGALLSHRGMMMCAGQTAARLAIAAGDRWTSIIPLFHCAGCIVNLLGSLQALATYVGVPSFDAEAMFALIEAERCTHLSGVPTSYLAMLDHPARGRYDLTSLKGGTCGGADCNPEVLEACARQFPMPGLAQVYGQTEASTLIACAAPHEPGRFATAGLPLPGYELRIADPDTMAELPDGTVGEIQGRGPMVMLGYYADPEATAETITEDGWLRTGDLGYRRPDGRLVIAGGRLRDMIIRGGENIYPVEIETVLAGHPAVAEVAVFAVADTYYGEAVGAAVRLAAPVSADELRAYCGARIARFKVPQHVFRVDGFPLTSSGKIRKVELRQAAEAGGLERLP